jgi:hypothetical protein
MIVRNLILFPISDVGRLIPPACLVLGGVIEWQMGL